MAFPFFGFRYRVVFKCSLKRWNVSSAEGAETPKAMQRMCKDVLSCCCVKDRYVHPNILLDKLRNCKNKQRIFGCIIKGSFVVFCFPGVTTHCGCIFTAR